MPPLKPGLVNQQYRNEVGLHDNIAHFLRGQKIDPVVQQEPQWGLGQRIEVVGLEAFVMNQDLITVSDHTDLDRRIVLKPDLAGTGQIELALGDVAVRAGLVKFTVQCRNSAQARRDLLEFGHLLGREICLRLGRCQGNSERDPQSNQDAILHVNSSLPR